MNGYERLANAIVIAAVKDYRAALKRLKKNPNSRYARGEVESIERFFRSDWYRELTDLRGEYLIEKLREEADM